MANTSACLLAFFLTAVLISVARARPHKDDDNAVYPCLDSSECENDTDAVYAIYRNESHCCHGGDAIVYSITGFGYKFTRSFYASTKEAGPARTRGERLGKSKRSADGGDMEAADSGPTYTCICKPVNEKGLDLDVYSLSVSALTEDAKDSPGAVRDILKDMFKDRQ